MLMRNGFTLIELPVRRGGRNGFTLIELLVVVTIIVVLLALLVPAMDKAVYEAELAVCMARFHGIGGAMVTYATENKRRYVYRYTQAPGTGGRPNQLRNWAGTDLTPYEWDDRPTLETALDLGILVDPLSPKISFKAADNPGLQMLYTSTPLWAGWRYEGQKGMLKLGDRFTSNDNANRTDPTVYRFNILAADLDEIDDINFAEFRTAHPDHEAVEQVIKFENETPDPSQPSVTRHYVNAPHTYSQWASNIRRGKVDQHYLFDDGSVSRYRNVEVQDDRMKAVPLVPQTTASWNIHSFYIPTAGSGK